MRYQLKNEIGFMLLLLPVFPISGLAFMTRWHLGLANFIQGESAGRYWKSKLRAQTVRDDYGLEVTGGMRDRFAWGVPWPPQSMRKSVELLASSPVGWMI